MMGLKTKHKAQIVALQAATFQLKKKAGQNQGKIREFCTAAFLINNKFLDQKSI